MRAGVAVSLLMGFTFTGCGPADSPEDPALPSGDTAAARKAEVVTSNGTNLNGTNLNGTNLNGTNLNGSALASTLAAIHFDGASWSGMALDGAWTSRGELRAQLGLTELGGATLVGSEWVGELGEGTPVTLRMASAAPDPSGGGVWRYGFEYLRADGSWGDACSTGDGVVVLGKWDYREGVSGGGAFTNDTSVFTLGCRGAAVEKCVGMGYRPWRVVSGTPVADLHASCVRAIRADFCGNGDSWTTNGRLINIYDDLGLQLDTRYWAPEAEWTPAGARCVSLIARNLLGITCSGLITSLSCGAKWHFDSGTLLMTETQTGPLGGILGW